MRAGHHRERSEAALGGLGLQYCFQQSQLRERLLLFLISVDSKDRANVTLLHDSGNHRHEAKKDCQRAAAALAINWQLRKHPARRTKAPPNASATAHDRAARNEPPGEPPQPLAFNSEQQLGGQPIIRA